MLINFPETLHLLSEPPKNLLACGGYDGSEAPIYYNAGIEKLVMVEPNPELYKQIHKVDSRIDIVPYAVSDVSGQDVPFHLCYSFDMTNKGCSSINRPEAILQQCPALYEAGIIKVETTTIDEIAQCFNVKFDVLVLDIESHELSALKGAKLSLKHDIKMIITEFSTIQRHVGGCVDAELDEYLATYGFSPVLKVFATSEKVWGDKVYIKDKSK